MKHFESDIEQTYKLDSAVGSSLVTLLAVEKETLAGLGSPRGNVMGDISGLLSLEAGDLLDIDGLRAKPEQGLGVEEVPNRGC